MRVNVGHSWRLGPFEQQDRTMRTSSEGSGLGEESAVHQRRREIRVRLSFNENAVIDEVVTDVELLKTNIEVARCSGEIEKGGVSFSKVDAEQMSHRPLVRQSSVVCYATRILVVHGRGLNYIRLSTVRVWLRRTSRIPWRFLSMLSHTKPSGVDLGQGFPTGLPPITLTTTMPSSFRPVNRVSTPASHRVDPPMHQLSWLH